MTSQRRPGRVLTFASEPALNEKEADRRLAARIELLVSLGPKLLRLRSCRPAAFAAIEQMVDAALEAIDRQDDHAS